MDPDSGKSDDEISEISSTVENKHMKSVISNLLFGSFHK